MAILLASDDEARDVLVFGSGAIGGAIIRRLCRRRAFTPGVVPVPWDVPSARDEALQSIAGLVEQRGARRRIDVVWAAGKAGFSATDEEAAGEFDGFAAVVDLAKRLPRQDATAAFHLISSAGGLYEGRNVRSAADPPTPLRSYGHLKLAQEQHAVAELSDSAVAIYRPSSVYTVPGQGGRPGLIGALVRNGMAQRPTTIVGALDTLRDYVMASDVGAYVADRVLDRGDSHDPIRMLVSGHPASILQIIAAVELVLRRRLYIRMADSWNARNITFSPAARAARFHSTPLGVGIRTVHSAALGAPIAG